MEKEFHGVYQKRKGCRKKEIKSTYFFCRKHKRRIAGIKFCKFIRRMNND
jgi:hypothetical protein